MTICPYIVCQWFIRYLNWVKNTFERYAMYKVVVELIEGHLYTHYKNILKVPFKTLLKIFRLLVIIPYRLPPSWDKAQFSSEMTSSHACAFRLI